MQRNQLDVVPPLLPPESAGPCDDWSTKNAGEWSELDIRDRHLLALVTIMGTEVILLPGIQATSRILSSPKDMDVSLSLVPAFPPGPQVVETDGGGASSYLSPAFFVD
ncbi:hypothetical protein BN1723_010506 [Verticillium longisporum]|uniref:Uncharacterized protein n=1 Tax=Verticillium longisporum TaxID=100787 RepID=A0A0G4KYK4_VERLO|nr:hypothetical protein BN1723_010506 [Verticillium longisporum]